MRTAKSLMGFAVVGQSDGTRLGKVRDLIFDHETNHILALVINEQDLFGLIEAIVVPWSEVVKVGADVVLVQGADSSMPLRHAGRVKELAETHRDTILSGTRIMTSDGQNLGTVADLVIDESTGQVLGYEISGGFVADSLHGKTFLPGSTEVKVGKDAALVPPSAVEDLTKKL